MFTELALTFLPGRGAQAQEAQERALDGEENPISLLYVENKKKICCELLVEVSVSGQLVAVSGEPSPSELPHRPRTGPWPPAPVEI